MIQSTTDAAYPLPNPANAVPKGARTDAIVRQALRHYPSAIQRAAQRVWQEPGDLEQLEIFVVGVLSQHVASEQLGRLRIGRGETRLSEDLGIDSLAMMEIAMLVEEALAVTLPTPALRELRTVGDVVRLLQDRRVAAS